MTFFGAKISIFTPKISDDLFLVIDNDFWIFSIFFKSFHIFAACNVIYMTLSSREKSLFLFQTKITCRHLVFTLFVLLHASDKHYFSKYWGGTDAWAVPHLK